MDIKEKGKSELENRNEESLSYHSLGISADWRYDIPSFANSSLGLMSSDSSMAVCGDAVGPSCSSGSMVDSFGPTVWENPVNVSPLGFSELNVHNGAAFSDPLSMIKGGLFLPSMTGMLPHSLSQFPTDFGFIQRAAQFSSFSGDHYGDVLNNPMGIHQSCRPFIRGGAMLQGAQELLSAGNGRKRRQNQKPDTSLRDASEDVSLPQEHAAAELNTSINETEIERFHNETKEDALKLGNDSDEPEFSDVAQEGVPSTTKDVGAKKRKRGNQDPAAEQANANHQQSGEAKKNNSDIQYKGEQISTPTSNKSDGKNGKQNSQASDSPKDEYIHVRARRGQATNSHSLAERVRREKISERMKFLQDLVPGCNKVTGKAVMLDEIINYVQSLQRQVEFLSMKLATVNPRLNFNIDRILAKDQMFSTRAGPSSGLAFSPDISMHFPPLHPSQSPMLPPGPPGTGSSSDAFRRVISLQLPNMGGGYKESSPQLPNVWDGELHNIVHMGFNVNTPVDNHETNCSEPHEQSKEAES